MYVERWHLLEKMQLEDPDKMWHQDIHKMETERSFRRTSFYYVKCPENLIKRLFQVQDD